jgi:urease accessory protein
VLVAREILGRADEERFAGRRVERLPVSWGEAGKRRLRRSTGAGTDVAVDLPAGSYLAHGAVLADDGERVIVVDRTPEEAVLVRPPAGLSDAALLAFGVRLGHLFGNQHVPVEVEDGLVRVPVTTSAALVEEAIAGLGLGAEVWTAEVRLACERPAVAPQHVHR